MPVGTLGGVSERRLISMISGEEKSAEQLKAVARQALQKWQEAQRAPEPDGPDSH